MKKFKKGPKLGVLDRVRAVKRTSSLVVKEIRGAKSTEELMNKHTVTGYCKTCGVETKLIGATRTCMNCSLFKDKKLKQKFKKHALISKCNGCAHQGWVDIDSGFCYNCYVTEGLYK